MKGEDDRYSSYEKTINPQDESPDEEEIITLDEAIEPPQTVPVPAKWMHAFWLAIIIVGTFAISIGLCFFYLFKFNSRFSEGLELFKTISAVLSGPLGFVLGYYFRVTETGSG